VFERISQSECVALVYCCLFVYSKMVLKPDQQRVCTMLKDTITLLCKNGLSFKKKFSIEAVIGVTLDDEYMFHVSLSEIIRSSTTPDDESENRSGSEAESINQQHKRKRRKRPRIKREHDGSVASSEDEKSDSPSQNGDQSDSNGPSEIKRPNIKGEPGEDNGTEGGGEEQDDIVFVKQEMDDNWSQSCSQGASNFAFSGVGDTQSHDPNISLSDMTLVPVGQGQDNNVWSRDGIQRQQYRPRIHRTSTVTTGGQPPGVQQSGDGQQVTTDPQQQSVGSHNYNSVVVPCFHRRIMRLVCVATILA